MGVWGAHTWFADTAKGSLSTNCKKTTEARTLNSVQPALWQSDAEWSLNDGTKEIPGLAPCWLV